MTILWTLDGDSTSWASWADNMTNAPVSALVQAFIPAYVVHPNSLALDIGCGTGRAFSPLNEAGFRVIGLDPIATAVKISRKRAKISGFPAWTIQATASQLPFSDHSASFILAVGVLFHLSESEFKMALQEIRRVLQWDGEAVLHFLDIDDWRRSLARSIQPWEAPVPSYQAVVTCFRSEDQIKHAIQEAGLELEALELRTSCTETGEQRNWFAICKQSFYNRRKNA